MCVPNFIALAQVEVWKKSGAIFGKKKKKLKILQTRAQNGHFREVIKTKVFGISTRGFQHRGHCAEILPYHKFGAVWKLASCLKMMPKMGPDAVGYIHYRERSPHSKIRRGEWGGDDRYRGRWIGMWSIKLVP